MPDDVSGSTCPEYDPVIEALRHMRKLIKFLEQEYNCARVRAEDLEALAQLCYMDECKRLIGGDESLDRLCEEGMGAMI